MRVIAWCKETVWNRREVEVSITSLAGVSSAEFEESITDWRSILDTETAEGAPFWDLEEGEVEILENNDWLQVPKITPEDIAAARAIANARSDLKGVNDEYN